MKHNFIKLAVLAVLFTSCEANEPKIEDLFITNDEVENIVSENGGRLLAINELLDEYMTEEGNFLSEKTPYRTRATKDGIYLFSIDTLPSIGTPLYIRGRVITEDISGNFYKSMVIQQIVNGEQQTLRLSVDASSISGQYALGQEILIRVNGLAIGRYANQPQLCVPSYNNNVYANKAEEKVGWAPGRIPFARFVNATKLIGLPDKSKIQIDTLLIPDFINLPRVTIADQDILRKWDGRLVCLRDVHFTGQYWDQQKSTPTDCVTLNPDSTEYANVFAPTTNNIGYPQSRIISDTLGHLTQISTSEYAKYARFYLPGCDTTGVANAARYTGNVVGILSYYQDNANYAADEWKWSISLRSLKFMGFGTEDDLQLKNKDNGEPWIPVEYGTK